MLDKEGAAHEVSIVVKSNIPNRGAEPHCRPSADRGQHGPAPGGFERAVETWLRGVASHLSTNDRYMNCEGVRARALNTVAL